MKRSVLKVGQLIKRKKNKPFSVFLLEDNTMYRKGVYHYMKQTFGPNIKVSAFEKSDNFMNALRSKPEVVVVDYHLDERSQIEGTQLIQEVRAHSPNTKIIVLSGEDSKDTIAECIGLGINDYVLKRENAIDKVASDISKVMYQMLEMIEKKQYKTMLATVAVVVVAMLSTVLTLKQVSPQLFD